MRPLLPSLLTLLLAFAADASAAPGDLDPTFGTGGIVVADMGSYGVNLPGIAVQPDGKLVMAGSWGAPSGSPLALLRYLENGTLDPAFGTAGMVSLSIGQGTAEAQAVALQPDGKIVVAGWAIAGGSDAFFVARFLPAGVLDPDFGTAGVTLVPRGYPNSYSATCLVLQPDGRIVVAGKSKVRDFASTIALVRYTAGGAVDLSFFGGAGMVVTDLNEGAGEARGVALQPDGKIVVAATTGISHVLLRYTPDGGLDFVKKVPIASALQPVGLVRMEDGRLVTAGVTAAGFSVYRCLPDGEPDPTFGVGGLATIAMPAFSASVKGFAVQSDGRVVVVGSIYDLATSSDWMSVRFLADGSSDPTFGINGKLRQVFSSEWDAAERIAIQHDGKLWVIGSSYDGLTMTRHLGGPLGPYEQWKLAELGSVNALSAGNGDADAFENLAEYGLRLSPTVFDTGPVGGRFSYPEGDRLRLIFTREPARNDVTIEVLAADDLDGPWTPIASSVLGGVTIGAGYYGSDGPGPGPKAVEVRDLYNVDDPAHPRRFLRLRVSR